MPELTYNNINGVCVMNVSGSLDSFADLEIFEEIRRMIGELGIERCVIDISPCDMITSMGVSHLVEIYRTAKKKEGLVAVCASPKVQRVLEISGLTNLLRVRGQVSDCLQMLES